jgi:hypothetical protein
MAGVGHIFWYHLETDGMDRAEHCKIGMKFALQTVLLRVSFEVLKTISIGFRSFEKVHNVSMMEVP